MSNEAHGPRPNSIYLPRSGEFIDSYVALLSAEPSSPLSPEQQEEVLNFERDLMSGVYKAHNGGLVEAMLPDGKTIAEVHDEYRYSEQRHELTVDYFMTAEGLEDLRQAGEEASEELNASGMARLLRKTAAFADNDTIKTWAIKSEAYATQRITDAIINSEAIEDPSRIVVLTDVTNLVLRARGFFEYRNFLTSVWRDIKQTGTTNENRAKQMFVELYQKRVNEEIAEIYPDLLYLWQQASSLQDTQRALIHEALVQVHAPLGTFGPRYERGEGSTFIVRLDRLRNGASLGEDGFSSVSDSLKQVFERPATVEIEQDPVFTPDEVASLDEIYFDAPAMQQFCKEVLHELGKLSSVPEDNFHPDRPVRAADDKWQVVIEEKTSAMGADDPPGVLTIPKKFKRSLTKVNPPVGVVPGAAHEISHIYQHDNIRFLPGLPELAKKLRGKRNTVMTEAGSIMAERQLQARLFGRYRGDNPHYMRAIDTIESGGGEIGAIRAFYESYLSYNPNDSKKSAAEMAVSRVKRLIRRKGGFDSQALNYAETALVAQAAESLTPEQNAVLFSIGAFDVEDLTRLHEFGLLPTQTESFDLDRYVDIVVPKLRHLLAEHKQAQGGNHG